MTRRVPIQVNVGNALRWLGMLYRNPADAVKEHISNAIDEHLKAQQAGTALGSCHVVFTIERSRVAIEYPYGMDKREFEAALQRVADSAKKTIDVAQIGRLGIGIFSFQQIGRKCTFLSRKSQDAETIRVTLREGMDEAEFDTALKQEALPKPGIKIIISELKFDPTKPRGPLASEKLAKTFSEKFDGYLRKGWLRVEVRCGGQTYHVAPMKIDLPRVGKGLDNLFLPGEPKRRLGLDLYFDPSGKGVVSVRHMGVVVVDDLMQLQAYGLEESVYASGYVKGFIDADFLTPLPARTGFEENEEWMSLLEMLDRHQSQIEAEVEEYKQQEREKALSEIQRRAIQLAREILDLEEFKDLEMLGGMAGRKQPTEEPRKSPTGERTGERSEKPGEHRERKGPRINYEETPFETGALRHSRFVGGVVQANELNPDFVQEERGTEEAKLAYATLIIGKETIAYNDKTGASDDYLERMLGFYFKLKTRLAPASAIPGKRRPGRPSKLVRR